LYKIVQKKEGTVEFWIQLILNNEETRKKCVSGLNSAYKNHFSPVNTSFVDKSSFKRNRKFRVLEKEVWNTGLTYHSETGVKKILAGCNLIIKLVKIWVYPKKFCEAEPCRDFFGVKTINCGSAPRCPVKYLPG
jgi:hypothetical protein